MALRQDVLLSNATIEITNLTLTGVLHSVNLKVERGSMCVLLGVPGSGKTSLIRSILGTVQPTSGSVRVYDQLVHFSPTFVPSAGIGYLPQDATLLGEGVSQFLTIEETLTYFGRFSLSNRALTQRTLFLTDLLNLPKGDRFVGHLNRDDHRLVALATALIHKPVSEC